MTTAQLEALRASMTSRFEGWERDAAASFLAAAYSRLRLRDEARSLVKSTPSTLVPPVRGRRKRLPPWLPRRSPKPAWDRNPLHGSW